MPGLIVHIVNPNTTDVQILETHTNELVHALREQVSPGPVLDNEEFISTIVSNAVVAYVGVAGLDSTPSADELPSSVFDPARTVAFFNSTSANYMSNGAIPTSLLDQGGMTPSGVSVVGELSRYIENGTRTLMQSGESFETALWATVRILLTNRGNP
jgi:hypothetical protein